MKSTATANPILTGHAVEFLQNSAEFVGRQLFPVFNSPEQSSDYYVFDKENMLNVPTEIRRAPGSPYRRSLMTLSDDSFATKNYGVEEPVDDSEYDKYASRLNADKAAINRALNIVLINHEIRVHEKATSISPTSSPGTKWDAGSSDPIGDINAAREVIHDGCGMDPNTLCIGRDVYNVLCEHPDVLDKIKHTQRGVITADLLAAVFKVDRVLVAGVVRNTAAEGQALSVSKIWGDDVILAHVNSAQDLKVPNFGRTFSWSAAQGSGPGGVAVESYREESVSSNVHRAKQFTDEKLVETRAEKGETLPAGYTGSQLKAWLRFGQVKESKEAKGAKPEPKADTKPESPAKPAPAKSGQ